MFIHYLKISFRNMWKHKTQSFIAIFGLAFGLACFVPALYWIRYETSFDNYHPDAANIYRIYSVEKQSGKVNELVPSILGKKIDEQLPAVQAVTSFYAEINNCKTEKTPHIRLHIINTDSTFFRVFKQEFVSGDAIQPLQTMFNIVLTESTAIRLFGDAEKAIGQQIQSTFYFFNPPYTVTAVVKDPSPHTNVPFDALLHHDLLVNISHSPEEYQWLSASTQTYIKVHPGANMEEMTEQLLDFAIKSHPNVNFETHLLPIGDVRHKLNSGTPFTLNFIRLFVATGILLLFSAIFHFLNLYLDLFRQRNRELHQRTVHGAKNRQLILQMLFELTCAILLALLLGCGFVVIARPVFSGLLDLLIELPELIRLFVICGIGVMTLMLFIGFITFRRLSHLALRPLSKGKSTGQPILRRMAVTLQIAVSVVFIVAAWVVMMQIQFVDRKDLGFNRNGIIQLHGLPPYLQMNLRTALLDKLQTIPQIQAISIGNFEPQHNAKNEEVITQVEWPGKPLHEEPTFNLIPTDHRFAEIFGLKILEGEWYKEGGDQNVVLNEEAVRTMGLSDPVGSVLRISIYNVDLEIAEKESDVKYRVVGVVKDFHILSLRSRIPPTIFRYTLPPPTARITNDNILYIRVTPGQEQETIRKIIDILPDIDPSFADLRLTTLDGLYDSFNHSEQAGLKIFSILATVCLLISLFGIYAVAAASTQRRRKEIAIRKVVGAQSRDIIRIFFREYILLTAIAGAFALPLAYLVMSHWLQGYAYRTNIPWWLLVGVIVGVVTIVLLTVLGQVLKATNSNPGKVVKSE